MSVDLPAPLSPMMARRVPAATSSDMSSTATDAPNRFVTQSTTTTGDIVATQSTVCSNHD